MNNRVNKMWSEPSSRASLGSPYGRNTTKAEIYISANDFGIYPLAQGKYPKKITKPIVLETVVLSLVSGFASQARIHLLLDVLKCLPPTERKWVALRLSP